MAFNNQNTLDRIRHTLIANCTGNVDNCHNGYCRFHTACAKTAFEQNAFMWGCKQISCAKPDLCGSLQGCLFSVEGIGKARQSNVGKKLFRRLINCHSDEEAKEIISELTSRTKERKQEVKPKSKSKGCEMKVGKCSGGFLCPKPRACEILGECVFNHGLIAESPEAVEAIKQARSIKGINKIFKHLSSI